MSLEDMPCDIISSILSFISHTGDITTLCRISKQLRLYITHLIEKCSLQDKLAAGLLKEPEWIRSMDKQRYRLRDLLCGRDKLIELSKHVLISSIGVSKLGIHLRYITNTRLGGSG